MFPHDDLKRGELEKIIEDELLNDEVAKEMIKSSINDEIFSAANIV